MKTLVVLLLVAFVAAEQKREAEPSYTVATYGHGHHYGNRHAYNPYVATSYRHYRIHKREAEADAEPGYGASSYTYGYGNNHSYGYSYRPTHYHHHKREAEAEHGYGFSDYGHGHGAVYGYRASIQQPGYAHLYQYNHGTVPSHYGHY